MFKSMDGARSFDDTVYRMANSEDLMQRRQWLACAAVLMVALHAGCGDVTEKVDPTTEAENAMTSIVRVAAAGIIEPVSLRLEYGDGKEELLSVLHDGEIAFTSIIDPGTPYLVTIASGASDCAVEHAVGVMGETSSTALLVCPMLESLQLVTARPTNLAFKPSTLAYAVDVPLLVDTTSVIAAALNSDIEIVVEELAVNSGQPSQPVPLDLGTTEIAVVAHHPPSGARLRYVLEVRRAAAIAQHAYGKASNTNQGDAFGISVALSANGDTMAVGAIGEDSGATGLGGNETDETASFSGAVYIFVRTGASWRQQAYLKASNTEAQDTFGWSLALSASGDVLAVSAVGEDSIAKAVGGDETDNTSPDSGAVYLFRRTGETWSQDAYIKASNSTDNDQFGYSVALSATGDTLAVSAVWEASAATGIDGNEYDNSAPDSGAVYIYGRTQETWAQEAYIKPSNTEPGDNFGVSVALSATGDTLAVGAYGEDSAATGVNGDETDNSLSASGAVYVFTRTGKSFTQEAYIKASNTGLGDNFGVNVALSATGDTLAVGAMWEDSKATGIDGSQVDNTSSDSGAVYVFTRTETGWRQEAYIKASNTGLYDLFGYRLALSATGDTLVVGAFLEDSGASGIGGDAASNNIPDSGAVYLFTRRGQRWEQKAYIKASNPGEGDLFGISVAVSANGEVLAFGAAQEGSQAVGIGGNQGDNNASNSGAVYLFH